MIKIKQFDRFFDGTWNLNDLQADIDGNTFSLYISDEDGNPIDDGIILTLTKKEINLVQAFDGEIEVSEDCIKTKVG